MPLSPTSGPGGGSSFTPVGAVLRVTAALSVRTVASHPLLWDAAVNNEWNATPITSMPSGLGITVALDGTSEDIHFTSAGTWAITLYASSSADATFAAQILDGLAFQSNFDSPRALAGQGATGNLSGVYNLPSGAILSPYIATVVAATANPYVLNTAECMIVRLG